jgi:hypothetical protein
VCFLLLKNSEEVASDADSHVEAYEPFDVVTKNALMHALAEHRIQASDETVEKFMNAYNNLAP